MAEFFFFDGEKIAESRKPERVKDSINTIMGLVPLEHMIKHLVSGRTNVQDDLHNSLKSNEGQEKIKARLNIIERDIKRAIENRDEAHNRFLDQSNLAENKRVEMEKIKDIAEDAAMLKEVDGKIIQAKKRIPKIEDDIIAAFVPALAETFGNILSLDILKNISAVDYDDKGIPGMEAAAIQFLLKNGRCICGADLKNDQDRQAHLKDLLTYLPPESIGSQISHLKRSLSEVEVGTGRQD